MRKDNGFNHWSISSQLQVVFIVTVLLLSAIIILITRLQLDWLESKADAWSVEIVEDSVVQHMKTLSRSQASGITYEFQNYMRVTNNTNEFNRLVFGQLDDLGQPLADSKPLWIEDCDPSLIYYNASSYNSRYGKSLEQSLSYQVIFNASRLNWILLDLYKENFLYLYQGFLENEMLNSFPGAWFPSWRTYTPIVREWFHKALEDPDSTIITEPYSDALSGTWIFTISKAIKLNTGEVIGVSATDITLDTVTSRTTYLNSIHGAFMVIATRAGLIISKPESWNISESVRIYDETQTGFSQSLWRQIKVAKSGEKFDFTDVNGTEYLMTVDSIKPFNSSYVTHYIFFFVEKTVVKKPANDLHDEFSKMKVILFWLVLGIELLIVALAVIFIYFSSRKAKRQLRSVNQLLVKIRRRAIFPNLTKNVSFDKVEANKVGIEKLVDALKEKVLKISSKEETFEFYKWGKTRPRDENLNSEWTQLVYPFNKYQKDSMSWNEALAAFQLMLKTTE